MDKERGDIVADCWANILAHAENIRYESVCETEPCHVTDILSVLTDEEIEGARKILSMLDIAIHVFDLVSPQEKMDSLIAHLWEMHKERIEIGEESKV